MCRESSSSNAVIVVDAGAGLGRCDQPPQHRRDAFGIDREIRATGVVLLVGFRLSSGLKFDELLGVDGDRVGLHRRGRRNAHWR
jgi:hypothetical protein